jgi:hypothetical protein
MPPKRKIKPRSKGMKSKISDRSFEAKNRAFHVIARMRHDGLSLREAAREENTTPATVKKLLPAALRRSKSGWITTKSDRYIRSLSLPGPHGPVMVQALPWAVWMTVSSSTISVSVPVFQSLAGSPAPAARSRSRAAPALRSLTNATTR